MFNINSLLMDHEITKYTILLHSINIQMFQMNIQMLQHSEIFSNVEKFVTLCKKPSMFMYFT